MRPAPIATVVALILLLCAPAAAYTPDDSLSSDAFPGPVDLTPKFQIDEAVPDADGDIDADGAVDEPGDHSGTDEAMPVPDARAGVNDIRYGHTDLPDAVAKTREDLLAAARSGDIEALRPIFARQRVAPIVAGFDTVDDPVAHLRLQSGDDAGREILAILVELLEGGHVAIEDVGTTYVWPYFAEVPLSELTPTHQVELYRILTSIDVEETERLGRYTFFRVGIAEDGRVRYFSAGALE